MEVNPATSFNPHMISEFDMRDQLKVETIELLNQGFMKSFRLCWLLIGCLLIGCSQGNPEESSGIGHSPEVVNTEVANKAAPLLEQGPVRGFTMGMHATDFDYDYTPHINEIAETGAPWISISFSYYQETNYSSKIDFPPSNHPFWAQLETTILQAKSYGLKVLLFPIVLLKNPFPTEWRGTIRPSNYDAWYKSYESMMVAIAELAEKTSVELLSVGSEFCSLERATKRWKHVIKVIRGKYSGALMYSGNWDTINQVQFHDQLDFLGLTGYFDLTDKKDPTVDELVAAWQPIKEQLLEWQKGIDTPLLFSELGYTSQDGCNMHPWNYTIPDELDLQEQADCYQAFSEVWQEEAALSGVFFYEWCGEPRKDIFRYTPRGKPALEIAKKWF